MTLWGPKEFQEIPQLKTQRSRDSYGDEANLEWRSVYDGPEINDASSQDGWSGDLRSIFCRTFMFYVTFPMR